MRFRRHAVLGAVLGLLAVTAAGGPALWRALDPEIRLVVLVYQSNDMEDPWGRSLIPPFAGGLSVADMRQGRKPAPGAALWWSGPAPVPSMYSVGSDGKDERGLGDDVRLLKPSAPRFVVFQNLRRAIAVAAAFVLLAYPLALGVRLRQRPAWQVAALIALPLHQLAFQGFSRLVAIRVPLNKASFWELAIDPEWLLVSPELAGNATTLAVAYVFVLWVRLQFQRASADGEGPDTDAD